MPVTRLHLLARDDHGSLFLSQTTELKFCVVDFRTRGLHPPSSDGQHRRPIGPRSRAVHHQGRGLGRQVWGQEEQEDEGAEDQPHRGPVQHQLGPESFERKE